MKRSEMHVNFIGRELTSIATLILLHTGVGVNNVVIVCISYANPIRRNGSDILSEN